MANRSGFAELAGKATSHRRVRHESGVVITVPGHGKQNLSQKHVGMIVRQLGSACGRSIGLPSGDLPPQLRRKDDGKERQRSV